MHLCIHVPSMTPAVVLGVTRLVAVALLVGLAGCGGGAVAPQGTAATGLAAVEAFPATPDDVSLAANPLLVDGDTVASAGIDVGSGLFALGDRDARDVGVRFPNATTPVNTIYVWFDRPMTPAVGAALAGTVAVFRSADNHFWSAVAVAFQPMLSAVENRIEIRTEQVASQFLKVVIRPLPISVTTDAIYGAVFVTEVQFFSAGAALSTWGAGLDGAGAGCQPPPSAR
jgi:hypothetical protein